MNALAKHNANHPDKYYEYPVDSVHKLNDSVTRKQMICGLYFREERFSPDDYYIWRMPILEIAHKGKSLPEGEAYNAYQESLAHIKGSREQLDSLCKRLMQKRGH